MRRSTKQNVFHPFTLLDFYQNTRVYFLLLFLSQAIYGIFMRTTGDIVVLPYT